MDNILQTLTIPQLGDPNFQAQFEEFCTAVANNFTRMVSIQYAKGEPGSSVYDATLNVGYDNGGITPSGATLLNAIFGTNIQSGDTQNVVKTSIEVVAPSIGTQMVFDEFMSTNPTGITININIDDEQHIAYIAQPYIFIDERIKNLRYLQDEYRENWHDFSIGIYGRGVYDEDLNQDVNDPNTWTWTLQAVAIVPKIYYDRNIHEFCWMVNEQQTGITAQGIKGDTGSGPAMIIAKGHRDNTKLWIDYIQCIDEQGYEKWAALDDGVWKYDDVEVVGPKADDLAIVFWDRDNPNDYQNAFVGKVYINTNQPYVYIPADDIVPRLDIFASIKGQNLKELMQTINKGNQGFPRGLMIPADPVQLPHGSQTNPSTYHLIYSEIGGNSNQDSQGRGKLHMTPIDPIDCEQSSQNPSDATYPGEMILDYNVKMRNLQVDTITIGDRQESPWNCKIKDPKLACMSRFKNFSYSLERQITKSSQSVQHPDSFKYTLKMSGILELNIGMLSAFNEYDDAYPDVTQIWKFAHEAFESYGANWDPGNNPASGEYSQSDKTYTDNFQGSGSRDGSKLYNVVNYEIPFELEKEVSWINDGLISAPDSNNIFGYKEFMFYNNTPIRDARKSIFFDSSSTLNNIQLRFGLIGWNCKSYDAYTQTTAISGATFTDENGTPIDFDINNDTDKLYICNPASTNPVTIYPTYDTTRSIINNSNIGEVSRLIDILKNNLLQDNELSLTGGIYYDPLECTLTYKFDIFARIFDLIDIDWLNGNKSNPTFADQFNPKPKSWPTNMNHKVLLKLVPIGYIGTSDQIYNTPIWNAINIKNELIDNNSLKSYDTLLNGLVENKHEYCVELCPPYENWVEEDHWSGSGATPITYYSFKPGDGTTHYDLINDPDLTGIIMHEENVSSDYIISVFTDENKQTPLIDDLETTYYDVMNNMRVVTNNLKVCPNNVNDGNWTYDSEHASYGWRSIKEVPYVIMPCDGYIGSTHIGAGTGEISKDKVKLGCANLKSNSAYWPMTLHGVLMYPYTSGIIRGKRPNNSLEVKCLKDTYEDATPISSDVEIGHYPDGKMMGVTNGLISGMVASNNAPTPPGPVTPTLHNPSITSDPSGPIITVDDVAVTITDNTTGGHASIYYTLDDTTPTSNSTPYTGPFTLNIPVAGQSKIIKAIAILGEGSSAQSSEVVSLTITRDQITTYYVAVTQRSGDKDNRKYRVRISANNPPEIPQNEQPAIWMDTIDVHPGNDYIYGQIKYHGNQSSAANEIYTSYKPLSVNTPDPNNLGPFIYPGTLTTDQVGTIFKISINDTHRIYPYNGSGQTGFMTEGDIYRESIYLRIRQDDLHAINQQVILRTKPAAIGEITDETNADLICTKSPYWISHHQGTTATQDFELQVPEDEEYIYGQFLYYGPDQFQNQISYDGHPSPLIGDTQQDVEQTGEPGGPYDPDYPNWLQWGFRFKIGKYDSGRIFDITYDDGTFKQGTPTS